jgi:hypothetical protein
MMPRGGTAATGCFALAIALLAAPEAAAEAGFEPRCSSENDFGWPRFHSRTELEADQKWTKYFLGVYGGLPTGYPVCVFDFWNLDVRAYEAAGLGNSRPIIPYPLKPKRDGDLYEAETAPPSLGIYHSKWAPVPNNTWVEVAHEVLPTEINGSWVWVTRGSGLWVNVGRTIVFPTPADPSLTHAAAIAWASEGCSVKISPKWPLMESQIFGLCVREQGYNSVQFAPQQGQAPVGTFGLTGLMEMVLADVDGDKGCGVADPAQTPLRSGVNASHACDCSNTPIAPSCGLMPKPPFPYDRSVACHTSVSLCAGTV